MPHFSWPKANLFKLFYFLIKSNKCRKKCSFFYFSAYFYLDLHPIPCLIFRATMMSTFRIFPISALKKILTLELSLQVELWLQKWLLQTKISFIHKHSSLPPFHKTSVSIYLWEWHSTPTSWSLGDFQLIKILSLPSAAAQELLWVTFSIFPIT